MIMAIDPGPSACGIFWERDSGETGYIKDATLKQIKELGFAYRTIIIEICDFPVMNAGPSFRDTNIMIGRLIEFFSNKCSIVRLGRKGFTDSLRPLYTPDDSGVIKFCKNAGYKAVSHAWQACGLLLYYKSI